jgi:predicted RNase H-like nuclease (RuvC/YqgF family)
MSTEVDTKVYFSLVRKQTVAVKAYDESGKTIYKTDSNGNPKVQQGRKVFERKILKFKPLKSRIVNGVEIKSCTYATSDKYEVKELDECVEDSASGVISEDTYNKTMNPLAYEKNKKIEKLEKTNSDLKKEVKDKDAALAQMKEQLEALRKPKG